MQASVRVGLVAVAALVGCPVPMRSRLLLGDHSPDAVHVARHQDHARLACSGVRSCIHVIFCWPGLQQALRPAVYFRWSADWRGVQAALQIPDVACASSLA